VPTRVRAFDLQHVMHAEQLERHRSSCHSEAVLRDLAWVVTAAIQEIIGRHSPVVPCSALVCYDLAMLLSQVGESASTSDDQPRRNAQTTARRRHERASIL
jgi:hypothetical protein